MKHKVGILILPFCILSGCVSAPKIFDNIQIPKRTYTNAKIRLPGHQEYAYVGSAQGIFEYRVQPDGDLKPLTGRPVQGSPAHARLCLNQQAGVLFAIDDVIGYIDRATTDHIYSYSIGEKGQLIPQTASPVKANLGVQLPVIDPQNDFLYLLGVDYATGEEKLDIYDVQQSTQIVKRQTIILPTGRDSATIGNVIPGQGGSSLFLLGRRNSWDGKRRWGELQEYRVDWRKASPVNEIRRHQMDAPLLAGVRIGSRLVTGDFSGSLIVCEIKDNRVNLLNRTALSKSYTGRLPGHISYRKQGGVLYVGTVSGDASPRTGTPAGKILVYHLDGNGQLQQVNTKISKAVGDPYPYVDNTGQFLYVSGAENTLDTYKIALNGRLSDANSRIRIASLSDVVFFGGNENSRTK